MLGQVGASFVVWVGVCVGESAAGRVVACVGRRVVSVYGLWLCLCWCWCF